MDSLPNEFRHCEGSKVRAQGAADVKEKKQSMKREEDIGEKTWWCVGAGRGGGLGCSESKVVKRWTSQGKIEQEQRDRRQLREAENTKSDGGTPPATGAQALPATRTQKDNVGHAIVATRGASYSPATGPFSCRVDITPQGTQHEAKHCEIPHAGCLSICLAQRPRFPVPDI